MHAAPAHPAFVTGRVARGRSWSVRFDPRTLGVCAVLAALVAVVGCWSISVGDFPIPITDVVATIFGGGSDDAQ
ncbi:MAG: hypothetical protein Q7V62_16865, partial [Actinomycetota bacterium]|nr:hypothetical protein [Actinomycetota bacterium]